MFGYAARQIFAAGNRNKPILLVLLLFAAACGLDHAAAMGLTGDPAVGMRAGFALVLMLIAIIGGRIIPAFTRNWLMQAGSPTALPIMANRFDQTAIAVHGGSRWQVGCWRRRRAWSRAAADRGRALHLVRLTRWAGLRTTARSVGLHPAHRLRLVARRLAAAGRRDVWPVVPRSSAMHALSAGAMATMTLAVMTRATRGHTARPLKADRATVAIYLLVTLGALLRVAAPLLPLDYMAGIRMAGALWGAAFLLFILVYGPMALRRPPARAGA